MNRLSVAREDYLRAISKLDEEGGAVTVTALAGHIGVRPPSVTGMVRRLVADGLVEHTPRAGVRLTARGESMALSVHRRHRLVETFLVEALGLDWSEVHEEAEALEHHLSERVVAAIDDYLGHPRVDPHGHPIPNARGEVIARRLCPLAELVPGEDAVIREVRSDDPERIRWWKERGLVPGARVHVAEMSPLDGLWRLTLARPDAGAGERGELVVGAQGLGGLHVERL